MARKYIHELIDWPGFTWDAKTLVPLLSGVRLRQGLLLGKMRSYGFASQWTAILKVLTEETIKSSAIEGVVPDPENVRSFARRLGLEVGGLKDSRSLRFSAECGLAAARRITFVSVAPPGTLS